MTERVVEHQLDVIQGMLQKSYDTMPSWKKEALMRWVKEGYDIIETPDRRKDNRRTHHVR